MCVHSVYKLCIYRLYLGECICAQCLQLVQEVCMLCTSCILVMVVELTSATFLWPFTCTYFSNCRGGWEGGRMNLLSGVGDMGGGGAVGGS